MPCIPAAVERAGMARGDLSYASCAQATWKWWCDRNGVEFVLLQETLGGTAFHTLPATVQRWLAPEILLKGRGAKAQIALVDADTMIRWDTPDPFLIAGPQFSAVRDFFPSWVHRSITAFQQIFPGVALPWWEYFNCGFVLLNSAQAGIAREFAVFCADNWGRLSAVNGTGEFGTDQTPFNFFLRSRNQQICFLPAPYNLLHCFPMDHVLLKIERSSDPDWAAFTQLAFTRPKAFEFIELGYIWHFTNVYASRRLVMEETWRRVGQNYKGADLA